MAQGIELFHEDGKASGVAYCSECRIVYKTKLEADQCHGERICECGKPTSSRFSHECQECQDAKWNVENEAREQKRFEAAKKVLANEYDGGFVYFSDRYFPSIDEAMDYIDEEEILVPAYMWACKNVGVRRVDLDDVTERIIEGMWEDADESDLNGIDELREALAKFNEANKSVGVWEVDYRTAILCSAIPPAASTSDATTTDVAARKDKEL